ncbi:MAG: hypothetical protein IKP20_04880 [Candidatus Methanomethylophilaceae archaeon]|nr:hypothetical protein [Candidatus Methanomethylophilaceae archaeon]
MVIMPLQCRFDRPDYILEDEEQNMYAYAMQIWIIQRELRLPLWKSEIYAGFPRNWGLARTIEFLPEYEGLSIDEKREFEE